MRKLYGKELDNELANRKEAREKRLKRGLTLRIAAKTNDMGLTPSEYCEWENGVDVCPHEKYESSIGGVHPPFIIFDRCVKCGYIKNAHKVTERNLEKAFKAFRMLDRKKR